MPNHRKPLRIAAIDGTLAHDPAHFAARQRIAGGPRLGEPSETLDIVERFYWEAFREEMPGLPESARCRLEIACKLRARMFAGVASSSELSLLARLSRELAEQAADASGGDAGDDNDL
jgi:hypothetical protein